MYKYVSQSTHIEDTLRSTGCNLHHCYVHLCDRWTSNTSVCISKRQITPNNQNKNTEEKRNIKFERVKKIRSPLDTHWKELFWHRLRALHQFNIAHRFIFMNFCLLAFAFAGYVVLCTSTYLLNVNEKNRMAAKQPKKMIISCKCEQYTAPVARCLCFLFFFAFSHHKNKILFKIYGKSIWKVNKYKFSRCFFFGSSAVFFLYPTFFYSVREKSKWYTHAMSNIWKMDCRSKNNEWTTPGKSIWVHETVWSVRV